MSFLCSINLVGFSLLSTWYLYNQWNSSFIILYICLTRFFPVPCTPIFVDSFILPVPPPCNKIQTYRQRIYIHKKGEKFCYHEEKCAYSQWIVVKFINIDIVKCKVILTYFFLSSFLHHIRSIELAYKVIKNKTTTKSREIKKWKKKLNRCTRFFFSI